MVTPANIDEYIAASPANVRPILREIRRVIRAAAPEAEERISYRMPAFEQGACDVPADEAGGSGDERGLHKNFSPAASLAS